MPKLSAREKNVILTGGLLLILFALVQFIYFPLADRQKDLQRAISAEQDALITMQALSAEYLSMNRAMASDRQQFQSRSKNFTLFSFLDTRAELSGVKQQIDYMKPSSQTADGSAFILSKVKLKLKSVYLDQCIDFLTRVESSHAGVRITSLSLNREGRSQEMLTMVMEAQTLVPVEGSRP